MKCLFAPFCSALVQRSFNIFLQVVGLSAELMAGSKEDVENGAVRSFRTCAAPGSAMRCWSYPAARRGIIRAIEECFPRLARQRYLPQVRRRRRPRAQDFA